MAAAAMVHMEARRALEELQLQDDANGACFDGGVGDPTWASVSHGIFISIGASGIHRSLSVKVSFVQSTTMDSWKPLHLRMMQLGGNRRFEEFLQAQGVPREMPIREKYQTKAAAWYRENLRAEAEGSAPPEPLAPNTGRLPLNETPSPEQLMLDAVFAKTPVAGDMTCGGVPADRRPSRSFASSTPAARRQAAAAAAAAGEAGDLDAARRCGLAAFVRSGTAHMASASAAMAELCSILVARQDESRCAALKGAAPGGADARSRSRSTSPELQERRLAAEEAAAAERVVLVAA